MAQARLHVAAVTSLPFEEHTYIAWLDDSRECLVVDPGLEPDQILEFLQARGLAPSAILNTHGHADHIAGNRAMKQAWPQAPLVIGRWDGPLLGDPVLNLSAMYGLEVTSPEADVLLDDGQEFRAAGFVLETRHVPGHSRGHVVFVWHDHDPPVIFGGDVLFAGGVGRTDFPGGSEAQLVQGIHGRLFTLPDAAIVLPGHGPQTTIGQEKQSNPFVGRPAGWQD